MDLDFRSVDPEAIEWRRGRKQGETLATLSGKRRVVVQTPWCACDVAVHAPGMHRVVLTLRPSDPTHRAFLDWISGMEDAASSANLHGDRRKFDCVWNNRLKLMLFSDTLVFDESGKLSADVKTAKKAAAVLELTGGWATDASWGLRWKVVQLKFSTEPMPPPPPEFCDDDSDENDSDGNDFTDD